ncbi:STAS domain-containing protein [Parasalinivibrio latis]|uniref:STAS domain-containing protein n=1 Tax=Parasalinivibrio latis TaxID=2952610 RepID=UPI0030DDFD2E
MSSSPVQPVICETVDEAHYRLTGVLDRDTVPAFWSDKANWLPKGTTYTVALSGLERIDSAGMAMLLHLRRYASEQNHQLIWAEVPDQLNTLLKLSNVDTLFYQG